MCVKCTACLEHSQGHMNVSVFFFLIFIYLLIYLAVLDLLRCIYTGSVVVACELLAMAYGIWFPDQGSKLGPLH